MTVKAAEALAKGDTFPESFTVPDLEPVPEEELALLMVTVHCAWQRSLACLDAFERALVCAVLSGAAWRCWSCSSFSIRVAGM